MEEWRLISGFEAYEVSNHGNVRKDDRPMKCSVLTNRYGYRQVRIGLTKDGKQTLCIVSRLVAKAFLPNPDELPTVDHIDRNGTNNHISNLRWATHYEQNMNRDHPIGASGHRHILKHRYGWRVQIRRHNQYVFIKCFQTIEAAVEARDEFLASWVE